jgi:hypothetical protein
MATLYEVLKPAETRGVAIGHFNVSDWVALSVVFLNADPQAIDTVHGSRDLEAGAVQRRRETFRRNRPVLIRSVFEVLTRARVVPLIVPCARTSFIGVQ